MSKNTAVVLAGGVPQIVLLNKLKAKGYRTVLVDFTEHPVAEKYADAFYRESTLDLDAVRKTAIAESASLIITCCTDQAMLTVSRLSEDLKLPCYVDAETGLRVTNKAYMKQIFQENGIPSAKYAVIDRNTSLPSFDYPLVVKPVDCNSSKGVRKVCCSAELAVAVSNALSMSRDGRAIVEEYVEGEELSLDCYIVDGTVKVLCVSRSDKLSVTGGFVISRGFYAPVYMSSYLGQAEQIAQQIADAFCLRQGPMLVQCIAEKQGIKVIEFSARTGGCIKYEMIERVSGVDVIGSMLESTLGKTPTIEPSYSNSIVSDEFVYTKEGVFGSVVGAQECVDEGLISSYHILHSPGKVMGGISCSGDRVLAFTIVAKTESEYKFKLKEVASKIDVLDVLGNSIIRRDLLAGVNDE